jgi:hypothetical protein
MNTYAIVHLVVNQMSLLAQGSILLFNIMSKFLRHVFVLLLNIY